MVARLASCLLASVLLVGASAARGADPDPNAGDQIARGEYLYETADCAGCHGSERNGGAPSGGLGLDTPFGLFRAPNITPDKEHGIGAWSETEFHDAIRRGVGRHGEYLFPVFPFTSFTAMNDSDIADLYAYLMSLPPVPEADKPHQPKPPFGWRPLLFFWRTLFFRTGPIEPDPAKDADWNRGNYLVHAVVHCEECHTPRNPLGALEHSRSFSGNVAGPDGQNAPNITSDVETGIGGWSVADIATLLKTGLTPESDQVGSGMKAVVRGTSKLTDADRHAIAVYLKSVPAIHVDVKPAKPPAS